MKAKVIIENGQTQIVLTPENDFDTDVVTKLYKRKDQFEIKTEATAKRSRHSSWNSDGMEDHQIVMTIDPVITTTNSEKYSLPLAG